MSYVNKIKTKDGTEYSINDLRIPEPTISDAGKVLGVNESGELAYVAGGSPTPVIEKGATIKLGGEDYLVLSANNDLTDVELVHVGPATISKYKTFAGGGYSPSSEEKVTFTCGDTTKEGIKYAGSDVDTYCNETFFATLPADVQAAIIDQDITQDIYETNIGDTDGDFYIDNTSFGGSVYRFKKLNTEDVVVGSRKCYMLSCKAIKDYYGGTTKAGLSVAKDFQLQE